MCHVFYFSLKQDEEAGKLEEAAGGEEPQVTSSASKLPADARLERAKILREIAEVCCMIIGY